MLTRLGAKDRRISGFKNGMNSDYDVVIFATHVPS